ncbi:MAG: cytochrome c oxidase subunit 3 [Chloroflexota bacterium]|nr:cytochrome c oxidase subunit 3 [Chloroflexota bacterium]
MTERTATEQPTKLPSYATGSASHGWWAIVLLIMIEATVFAGLIASYFYLFANATVWPPDGIDQPKLLIPTIYTVVLGASIIPAWIADRSLREGDINGLRLWRAIGTVMLLVFLGLKAYEYLDLDYTWREHAYSSIVWTIAGFHSAHVLIVLIKTLSTQTLAWKGFFNQRRRSAVQGTTLYWLFVVIVWLVLYPIIYLFPNYA